MATTDFLFVCWYDGGDDGGGSQKKKKKQPKEVKQEEAKKKQKRSRRTRDALVPNKTCADAITTSNAYKYILHSFFHGR